MPNWDKKFKPEYDYARGWLDAPQDFAKDWQPLVKRLHRLMGTAGFDAADAAALGELRLLVRKGAGKEGTEDRALLEAVGAWSEDLAGGVDDKAKMRAAALKLLRHVYLLNAAGNRKVWVVSLPNAFRDWPSDDFNSRTASQASVRQLLASSGEIFSADRKRNLASAAQHGIAWCHKTVSVLSNATKGVQGKGGGIGNDALAIVKRWFAGPATSNADLGGCISTLHKGFKDIIARLGRGHLVFSDWVPLRPGTTQDELDFLDSEAFTFASNGEGMDVVYIERSFFTDYPGNVLKGQTNWVRIVVDELTHLVCGTTDVNIGNARYAWYGIGPHAGFPGSAAIRNADSWAFFCADCAGMLTDAERKVALKII